MGYGYRHKIGDGFLRNERLDRRDRRERQNEHLKLLQGVDHLELWPDMPDSMLQQYYDDAELERRDFEDAGGTIYLYEPKKIKRKKRKKRIKPKGPTMRVKNYSNPIRKPNYNG